MDKKYSLLLFDLDGTLTDSKPGILNSMKYAFEKLGYAYDGLDLNQFLGPPLADTFQQTVGTEYMEDAIHYFRERYAGGGMFENTLYDGVVDMLDNLRNTGCKLAIATSKLEHSARIILEHFGIIDYFATVTGSLFDNSRQKKTEVITLALELTGFANTDALMIGDRYHDLDAAAQLGIDAMGVLYGYGSMEELSAHPSIYLAESPSDVCGFLQERIETI